MWWFDLSGCAQLGIEQDHWKRGGVETRLFCSLLPCCSLTWGDCVQTISTDLLSFDNGMEEGPCDQLGSICSISLLWGRFCAAIWDRVRSWGMLQLVRELGLLGGRPLLVQCLDTSPCAAFLATPPKMRERWSQAFPLSVNLFFLC